MPLLVVKAVHLDQIREHGGLLGLRDERALESALARAKQRFVYEPESDLPRLAAAYAHGIATNHPFKDGNKRIAFLTAAIFLALNGFDLMATEDEVVERMVALAAGTLGEDELAEWMRGRVSGRG